MNRIVVAGLVAMVPYLVVPAVALAQDAGSTPDAGGAPRTWMCPGAINSASQPVTFRRTAPVDFGPGTGMRSIGSHSSLGLDFNLLFSGRYDTEMRGTLDLSWPRGVTIGATGTPMGGYLEAWFGLRMSATLWVAGLSFPIPLSFIIDDNEGHGRAQFTPWAWNYEGTSIHLNVSAWRTLYRRTVNVFGSDVDLQVQVRYNTDVTLRTLEIGFPDRSTLSSMPRNITEITPMRSQVVYPPAADGRLALLTRWRPQIRYQGSLEFRVVPRCVNTFDLVCQAGAGLLGAVLRSIQTGTIVESRDILPDPYDQEPRFDLPVQQVERTYVDFGDVRVGETAELSIDVRNPGSALLAVEASPSESPLFRVGTGVCVAPGATGRIPVRFTPNRIGRSETQVTIDSNGTLGTPIIVTLAGAGATETRAAPTPSAVDAGVDPGDGGRRRAGDGGRWIDSGLEGSCECRAAGHCPGRSGCAAWVTLCVAGFVTRLRRRRV